jgi:hypothetical protein
MVRVDTSTSLGWISSSPFAQGPHTEVGTNQDRERMVGNLVGSPDRIVTYGEKCGHYRERLVATAYTGVPVEQCFWTAPQIGLPTPRGPAP